MTDTGETPDVTRAEIGQIFREASGQAIAALIRVFGDIDVAEDAVQEAFVVALRRWPIDGPPREPAAWIQVTARRKGVDRLRRESLGRALVGDMVHSATDVAPHSTEPLDPMDDDQLRLIFLCCHPALSQEAQVALTLRLASGLSTHEVAAAFLIEEPTMAQRIVRAKRKIKSAPIPYRVPDADERQARLSPVLAVCYLIYNAGSGQAPLLSREGIRLARLLSSLMPNEAEVRGLLALMLLDSSRDAARLGKDGSLIRLRDQQRCLWSSERIREGQDLVRECIAQNEPGPYQLQAAIQAVHSDAHSIEATDWAQIVHLYSDLLAITQSPVVALNRAIAVGESEGPAAALRLVDELPLAPYYLWHATRADLLARLDRAEEARDAYEKAEALAPSDAESRFLRAQIARLLR